MTLFFAGIPIFVPAGKENLSSLMVIISNLFSIILP